MKNPVYPRPFVVKDYTAPSPSARNTSAPATAGFEPADSLVLQALELVRDAGQVLLLTHTRRGTELPLDPAAICLDEEAVVGSYSSDFTLQTWVARIVFSRKLNVRKLIANRFSLMQVPGTIQLAAQPTDESMKMVVEG